MLANAEEALNISISISEDKKAAEYYLLNYEKELRLYESAKCEYIEYKKEEKSAGSRGNKISNPVEREVFKKIEFDRSYVGYRWLKAVEIVQRGLGERKNIFIRVRREAEKNNTYTRAKGRKGWVVYVQRRYSEEIESRFIIPEVWVSEKTIRSWWNEIINYAVFVANKIK